MLVEKDMPGFSLGGTFHTMGGENLHEVHFENCELPLENLVVRDDGFVRLLTAFNTQRCLNPSISLGLAEGAFEEAVRYARERQAFGRPIGEFQGMRWKLAEMYKEIETGRSILYRACATANPFPDPAGTMPSGMSRKASADATSLRVPSPPHASTSLAPRSIALSASSRA